MSCRRALASRIPKTTSTLGGRQVPCRPAAFRSRWEGVSCPVDQLRYNKETASTNHQPSPITPYNQYPCSAVLCFAGPEGSSRLFHSFSGRVCLLPQEHAQRPVSQPFPPMPEPKENGDHETNSGREPKRAKELPARPEGKQRPEPIISNLPHDSLSVPAALTVLSLRPRRRGGVIL